MKNVRLGHFSRTKVSDLRTLSPVAVLGENMDLYVFQDKITFDIFTLGPLQ